MTYAGPGALDPVYAVEPHGPSHLEDGRDPVAGVVPKGGIILWSGAIAQIPFGWALCDGTLGTPNLEDRFVVGAGSTYAVAATGGSATQANHTVTQPTAHGAYDHAHHVHGYDLSAAALGYVAGSVQVVLPPATFNESPTLSHPSQSHTGTDVSAHGTNLPPYYALAYIMRVA